MKLAALIFFALLVHAHEACGLCETIGDPLCSFREGPLWPLGYALFCAIALVGVFYIFGLQRSGEPAEASNIVSFGVLLAIVVATPSWWAIHEASACMLLASVYLYFALLLYRSARPFVWFHLAMPVLLAVATGFASYGLWQKAFICYFVLAIAVHHHVLKCAARKPVPPEPDVFYKGRKVYRLEAGCGTARSNWVARGIS
jgi:hypothetical protein